jgi:hypothetical protein
LPFQVFWAFFMLDIVIAFWCGSRRFARALGFDECHGYFQHGVAVFFPVRSLRFLTGELSALWADLVTGLWFRLCHGDCRHRTLASLLLRGDGPMASARVK